MSISERGAAPMSPEDLKRIRFHARTMAAQTLIAQTGQGQAEADAIRALAAGMVEGTCDAITAYANAKVAFDLLHGVLDQIGAPLLADQPAGLL